MLQNMLAAQKRKKKKKQSERKNETKRNSSGKIEFKKLVANVETSIVLHRQAHKAALCSAEAEVDSSNNGELGLYPDPRHVNRVRLIPLCGQPACQAFLVRGVLYSVLLPSKTAASSQTQTQTHLFKQDCRKV